jgi:hypothetical protein
MRWRLYFHFQAEVPELFLDIYYTSTPETMNHLPWCSGNRDCLIIQRSWVRARLVTSLPQSMRRTIKARVQHLVHPRLVIRCNFSPPPIKPLLDYEYHTVRVHTVPLPIPPRVGCSRYEKHRPCPQDSIVAEWHRRLAVNRKITGSTPADRWWSLHGNRTGSLRCAHYVTVSAGT